jgi:hypothetical protein
MGQINANFFQEAAAKSAENSNDPQHQQHRSTVLGLS